MRKLLLLLFALVPRLVLATPVVDGTPVVAGANGSGAQTITFSTSGTNRVCVLGVGIANWGNGSTPGAPSSTSVTWLAASAASYNSANYARTYVAWVPTAVTNEVTTVNFGAGTSDWRLWVSCWSAAQDPTGLVAGTGYATAIGGAHSTAQSASITTVGSDSVVVGVGVSPQPTFTLNGSSSMVAQDTQGYNAMWMARVTGAASGTYTLGGTMGVADDWAVAAVEILAQSGATAATPTSAPGAGTYTAAQSVTLACTSPSPTILYCTDTAGTCTPATTYTSAFTVSSTSHVRAICQSAGLTNSAVMDHLYTIQICATPTFTGDQPGNHPSAAWTNIALGTTTGSCAIHYTTTGVDPTSSDATYTTALTVSSTTTVKAIATATGWGNSGVLSGTFSVGNVNGGLTGYLFTSLHTTLRRWLPGHCSCRIPAGC